MKAFHTGHSAEVSDFEYEEDRYDCQGRTTEQEEFSIAAAIFGMAAFAAIVTGLVLIAWAFDKFYN